MAIAETYYFTNYNGSLVAIHCIQYWWHVQLAWTLNEKLVNSWKQSQVQIANSQENVFVMIGVQETVILFVLLHTVQL